MATHRVQQCASNCMVIIMTLRFWLHAFMYGNVPGCFDFNFVYVVLPVFVILQRDLSRLDLLE